MWAFSIWRSYDDRGCWFYSLDGYPITDVVPAILWLALLGLLSFLMVSTWRYWSFKDLNLLRPRTPLILVLICAAIFALWNWSQPGLLVIASFYGLQRHRHSAGRYRQTLLPATAETESGDTGWLKRSRW